MRERAGARRIREQASTSLLTRGDDYRELDLLQETRAQLGLAPPVSLSAGDLSARLRRARYRRVQIQEVRLPVVHDSVASYLAYRQAFGVVRHLLVPDPDDLLRALTDRAESYTDDEGRVVLDWQLLVMSARA